MLLLSCIGPAYGQQQDSPRRLTYDDLLRLKKIGGAVGGGKAFAFSPSGKRLAYVVQQSKADAPVHDLPRLGGNGRADIWVASTAGGGEPKRITGGTESNAGYWNPVWSPGGDRLAMFSNAGGNLRLWVWNRKTREVRRLSDRGISSWSGQPVWLSDSALVVPVLPAGQKPPAVSVLRETPKAVAEASRKVRKGQEVTASILKSGPSAGRETHLQGQLVRFDLKTGDREVLFEGKVRSVLPAPNGRLVAGLVRTGTIQPDPDKPLRLRIDNGTYQVRLFGRDSMRSFPALKSVKNVVSGSMQWSSDGSRIVFATVRQESDGRSYGIFAFTPSTGRLRKRPLGDLEPLRAPPSNLTEPLKMAWSPAGQLLVLARKPGTSKVNWWAIDTSGERENLTDSLPTAPRNIYRIKGRASWVGLSRGEVWKFSAEGSEIENLTADFSESVASIAWAGEERTQTEGVREVLFRVGRGDGSKLYHLNVKTGRIAQIGKPSPEARLVDFSTESQVGTFRKKDRSGSYLWLAGPELEAPRLLHKANTFLRGIAKADLQPIKYLSLDGDSLRGWIMKPVGYEGGKTYPLVTWVYAGAVMSGKRPPGLAALNNPSALNLQLLAAQGYAVLFPSMPLVPFGETGDPYMELTKGVLPAVSKAIERGIAAPEQLAVMGQSYGGYSTYGLITQTDRFQAAIAMAGPSNLISTYGRFDPRRRYGGYSLAEHYTMMALNESGQSRMGSPHWKDFQRYIRNSPISYVERVETPLLIIQGSLDFVPIQQGEQFFSALYRQNKRAKFVRYVGEGHVLSSPANVRHMWQQIFGWLDRYVKPEQHAPRKEAAKRSAGDGGADSQR